MLSRRHDHSLRASIGVLGLIVALGACTSDDDPGEASATSESDVGWVQNRGSGLWEDSERWQARETLRLGTVEGDGPEAFGRVWDLAMFGDLIAVLDLQAQDVRIFNRDGTHEITLGGRGDGPDDFSFAEGLVLDDQDRLWVADSGRLLRFGPTARVLESRPFTVGLGIPDRLTDSLATSWVFDPSDRKSEAEPLGPRISVRPIVWRFHEERADTFPRVVADHRMINSQRVPLSAAIRTAPASSPDEFWFSASRDYTITRRTLSGDTVLRISLADVDAARITDSVRTSLSDGSAEIGSAIPDRHPAVDQLVTDGVGHLLVFPYIEGFGRGSVVDVFREDSGDYLGRVQLPVIVGHPAPQAGPGYLLVSTRDELGVGYVVRLELGPPR